MRRHLPALIWTALFIVGPIVGKLINFELPAAIAVPVGILSPVCAAGWRLTR